MLFKERGLDGASIFEVINELKYPMKRLATYFETGRGGLSPDDAYIFAFFFDAKICELRRMAKEIDAQYESPGKR